MARPVSGKINTCEIRRPQKNSNIYVYKREYIYSKRQNKCYFYAALNFFRTRGRIIFFFF